MKTKLIGIFLSVFALNTSANDICDLHKAKAELAASILATPYVYGASNENNTATVGLGYSLSGRSKGNLTRDIAEAKCDLLASTSLLDDQQKWIMVAIQKHAARAELSGLLKARQLAAERFDFTRSQFESKTVTLTEYNNIRQLQQSIDTKILSARTILAEPSQPVDNTNIKQLLDKAKVAEGKVAELQAKLEAANGWDVTFTAGAQKDLLDSNSDVSPFAGIVFKWSFGSLGSGNAINRIKEKSEAAFISNPLGYVNNSTMLFNKVEELIKVEQLREQALLVTIQDTEKLIVPLTGLDTSAALSSRKLLEIQIAISKAELAGAQARISKYVELLAKGR
jgi:hypothetical protein